MDSEFHFDLILQITNNIQCQASYLEVAVKT